MIKKLKLGIETADWSLIEEAYEELTGVAVRSPSKIPAKKRAVKKKKVVSQKSQDQPAIVESKPQRLNLFNPADYEHDIPEHERTSAINDNVPPVPRTRPQHKECFVGVQCMDCDKTVQVLSTEVRTPFYCEFAIAGKKCPRKTK
jgi:hypothetical protein